MVNVAISPTRAVNVNVPRGLLPLADDEVVSLLTDVVGETVGEEVGAVVVGEAVGETFVTVTLP